MEPIKMELIWEIINEVKKVPAYAPPGSVYLGKGSEYLCDDVGCAYPGDGTVWPEEIIVNPNA